jgi:hypothetical protein
MHAEALMALAHVIDARYGSRRQGLFGLVC